MKRTLLILPALLLIVAGCKKEVELSPVPSISVVSVTPANPKEYQDTITIVLGYEDGDGDLGQNDPTVHNLFVQDSRLSSQYPFRIPQLGPTGATVAIQGNLNVKIPPTGITNGASSQTATFSLTVVDRAGHSSNTVNTPSVTITQ